MARRGSTRRPAGSEGTVRSQAPGRSRVARRRAALALAALLTLSHAACQTAAPGPLPAPEPPPAPRAEPAPPSRTTRLVSAILADHGARIPAREHGPVAAVLERAERALGLDALLVLAVIQHESRFDPAARSPRGSLGLMQLRPFVAADVATRHGLPWEGERTLLEPAANVQLGTLYLSEMLDLYGDLDVALAAYNLGPTRVRRLLARGQRPRPPYVERVEAKLEALADRYGHHRSPGSPTP